MTQAMHRLAEQAHPAFPVTIYYAFKQAESDDEEGTASTGWDTFLDAVIHSGFATSGTWPMRTENDSRLRGQSTNALASKNLVCRPRAAEAPTATRREFVTALKAEVPLSPLFSNQRGNIAQLILAAQRPSARAQHALTPGCLMLKEAALRASGVGADQLTLDEALAEQEGDFDADSRWAITWFEQVGFDVGDYGTAEQLSKSKNTSISGMVDASIVASKGGKVRLLKPDELPEDWDLGERSSSYRLGNDAPADPGVDVGR